MPKAVNSSTRKHSAVEKKKVPMTSGGNTRVRIIAATRLGALLATAVSSEKT